MQKIRFPAVWPVLFIASFAFALGITFLMVGGAQSQSAARSEIVIDPAGGEVVFPRVQIIQWRDGAGRFDSVTGEIQRFHGDLDNPAVRPTWRVDVPPVRERTSGMLRIQHPVGPRAIDAPFLVDVVTGETWLLQRRPTGATWVRVDLVH